MKMELKQLRTGIIAFLLLALVPAALSAATNWRNRPVTDLLKGEEPFEKYDFNVGSTGFRGWVFHRGIDSSESRQILVKRVDKGSPADGILEAGDVILGADGTGKDPQPFKKDARRTIADAITTAEARNPATLKLLRWRKGETTTITLTLKTLGAYSDTAPYSCEKSRTILNRCARAFYEANDPGTWSLGLFVLLAVNDPQNPENEKYQARAREWARKLIVPKDSLNPRSSKVAWGHSYRLLLLAEYYLQTRDKEVLPTLEAYADCYARHQSWFGTTGHQYSALAPDGSTNGPMAGYGAINGTGVAGLLGMQLAREAGIQTPELDTAIHRAQVFFASFATKSGIPYGEHSYGSGGGMWDMNGKNATVALAFMKDPKRLKEGRYFAKLTTASSKDRQASHAGPFFNYFWPPLGAAAVGEKAAAHYFKRTQWLYDMERKWDGTMVADSFGHHPKYRGFPGAAYALLTYALPLRKLFITGRGHDRSHWLSDAELAEVIAAEDFDAGTCDLPQLLASLKNWAPQVRYAAARELGKRSKEMENKEALLSTLHTMAADTGATPFSRNAACLALGEIRSASSAPVMAGLLKDPDSYVRYGAARTLRYLDRKAVMSQLDAILEATATTVRPAFPLVEGDPLQFAHHQLAMLLFYGGRAYGPQGLLSKSIKGVDRTKLWPAVRAVARTPSGQGRSTVGSVYKQLTKEEVLELADTIVQSTRVVAPADAMFAGGVRMQGIDALERNAYAEGVPLCKDISDRMMRHAIKTLDAYGGSVLTANPKLDFMQFVYHAWAVKGNDMEKTIARIHTDPKARTLIPMKRIESIEADPAKMALPVKETTLTVKATNYVMRGEKDSIFTWRKVYGPGPVTFTPNRSWQSRQTRVDLLQGKPGKYRFEVTMSDTLGYSTVCDTIDITLTNQDGSLPPNKPPVANTSSTTVPAGVPLGIALAGKDPEGDELGFALLTRPSHGSLTGTSHHRIYTGNPGYSGPDSFEFIVTDGQGVSAKGSFSLTVAPAKIRPTVYEGFDCKAGPLGGQSGATAVGLDGTWKAQPGRYDVTADSIAYPALPSTGGKMESKNWGRRPPATRPLNKEAMARDKLLEDGKELWWSVVVGVGKKCNRTNGFLLFGLKDGAEKSKTHVGFRLARSLLYASANETLGKSAMPSRGGKITLPADKPNLLVGRCRWGKDGDSPDTVELYRVLDVPGKGPVLLKKPISTVTGLVDQASLDTLYFEYNEHFLLDEIRIGPSYESVLLGTVPAGKE